MQLFLLARGGIGTSLNSRYRALAKTFLSDARKSQVNFSILGQCFGPIFGQIVSIRVKALSDTNLAKREMAYFRLVSLAAVFWMSCNAPPTLFFWGWGGGGGSVSVLHETLCFMKLKLGFMFYKPY